MIKKIKAMDPMTKTFAKVAAVHVATIAVCCVIVIKNAKKNSDS